MTHLEPIYVKRRRQRFIPDSSRVITRFFGPGGIDRQKKIIQRVLTLTEEQTQEILNAVLRDFSDRHLDLEETLLEHYQRIENLVNHPEYLSQARKLLIGSFFTKEYSIESAAFFNPSIVAHPIQENVTDGAVRVILSFRAVGEGHISSLQFRSGVLDENDNLMMGPVSPFVEASEIVLNPSYEKKAFIKILKDGIGCNGFLDGIFAGLPDRFQFDALTHAVEKEKAKITPTQGHSETIEMIYWVARSNFIQNFDPKSRLSERVIFPTGRNESNGLEDARFVRFKDDDGEIVYYATYTAYNGRSTLPMLLQTRDFLKFTMLTLHGDGVHDKGMALFPRRLNGKYAMISRQDGENLYLMYSDHINFWDSMQLIRSPEQSWEFVQIGNCGSPIETENGWLLLTHGVGAMRKYCIGAVLLDLEDPSKTIGRLEEPLIMPNEYEREGYVPNVVYTCGALLHNGTLVIPYAVSDTTSGIATVEMSDMLSRMV